MEDDQDSSQDERFIELSSVQAIFPELEISGKDVFTAVLDIQVQPVEPLKIHFEASSATVPPSSPAVYDDATAIAKVDVHELSFLPPLTVCISLPEGYPIDQPPQVELSSNPQWVPKSVLTTLGEDCKRLWTELGQDQVVYTFIDHVQQAAESAFGIGAETGGRFELPGDIKISLLDFDLKRRKEQFESGTFDCRVCLEPKKGLQCHRLLLCGHVFCVACLQDFYNNAISEGDVDGVKCLAPGCGKDEEQATNDKKRRRHDRTLNPSELLQIPISSEQVQRYVHLKRKKKLEADKDTIYCPRQWCQGAAKSKKHPKPTDPFGDFEELETGSEEDLHTNIASSKKTKKRKKSRIPMSERLAVCEDCDFAFCSVCEKGWHGELGICRTRRKEELDAEEKATLAYLERYSTPCPTCKAPAQKTLGCNHMICFQCRTHFCYLCSAYLMPENPYAHFNDPKSSCHMKLWELEAGDGLNLGLGVGARRGAPPVLPPEPHNNSDTGSDSDESDESDVDAEPVEEQLGNGGDFAVRHVEYAIQEPIAAARVQQEPNLHIEIVNFAANGANQRIQLPDRPGHNIPPHAPDPPVARPHVQERNRRQGNRPVQHRARQAANGLPQGAGGRLQQDQVRGPGPAPVPARVNGLERFLQLALNDQEDEWDSDELDEDDFDAPEPPLRNVRRAVVQR